MIVAAVLGYVLGSIPGAVLVARAFGVDIRRRGSGNPGASNALRVLGIKAALPTAGIDIGKGVLAVWAAAQLAPPAGAFPYRAIAGAAAVAGHIWPVFGGFKGGKGVATAAGVMGALCPPALALVVPVFAVAAWLSRTAAVASLSAAAAYPLMLLAASRLGWAEVPGALYFLGGALYFLLVFTHRANIQRLLAGTEPRFGKKTSA